MPNDERPIQDGVRLMNIRDAARYLGTTPATLYTKIWRREIPFVKFGRSVRFDVKDLDALIEESKVKPDALNNCRRLR
jgi:excisionase family DNA binding protein